MLWPVWGSWHAWALLSWRNWLKEWTMSAVSTLWDDLCHSKVQSPKDWNRLSHCFGLLKAEPILEIPSSHLSFLSHSHISINLSSHHLCLFPHLLHHLLYHPYTVSPTLTVPLISICLLSSPSGQLVALQPRQGADISPARRQADHVFRQWLWRKLSPGEEVLRPPHRLPHRQGWRLAGRAHAGEWTAWS